MTTQAKPVPAFFRVELRDILDNANRLHLCLMLTLLLLLLYSEEVWYIKIPLSVIAIAGFIFPRFQTSRVLWGLVVVIVALGTYGNWYSADNHKYLLGYWCLAIFLALLTEEPAHALHTTARWLVALVFVLAVVHKSLSNDYLNGAFFYYELLLDERFSQLARYVGGVPDHMSILNHAARQGLVGFDSTLSSVRLQGTTQAAGLAAFITWWNYVIQVVIGILFLLPSSVRLTGTRHVWLLLFLFTAYLFAPVIGFGWVLAIMGIAQTGRDEAWTRGLYVLAFLFLQVYRIPWRELLSLIPGFGTG